MSQVGETFFTTVGCMDGRVQNHIASFGKEKFHAEFPDTITEAGLVGILGKDNIDQGLLNAIKNKINISLEKHHSKGIVVHGHQECAGNPVEDNRHREDIKKTVEVIRSLVNSQIEVIGVFVKRSSEDSSKWVVEEL